MAKDKKGEEIIEKYYLLKGLVEVEISFFKYTIKENPLKKYLISALEKALNYTIIDDFYLEGKDLMKDYKKSEKYLKEKFPSLNEEDLKLLIYYFLKEMTYKDLLPLFLDGAIEDITIKENSNVFIYHDKFGWLETNIFLTKHRLEQITSVYAERAYTFISLANPFAEGILPDKDRFAAIYRLEETGFTIRRFKKKKFSIIDIINYGTLDIKTAAYLWSIIENPVICKLVINGPTGSGKTTFLNSVLNFIPTNKRIVAIEERVSELDIPIKNHLTIIADSNNPRRTSFQALVNTLRQRPDYIVVGEIRGKETKIFFQALNSVAYDEPVLLLNKKTGDVEIWEIGKFIDNFYEKGEEKVAKKKSKNNKWNVEDWKVLALDKNGMLNFCDIKYVLRHKINGEIYKITGHNGATIKLTGNHSIFVFDMEKLEIKIKKVEELKEGDIVMVAFGKTLSDLELELLLEEWINKKENERYLDKLSEIDEEINNNKISFKDKREQVVLSWFLNLRGTHVKIKRDKKELILLNYNYYDKLIEDYIMTNHLKIKDLLAKKITRKDDKIILDLGYFKFVTYDRGIANLFFDVAESLGQDINYNQISHIDFSILLNNDVPLTFIKVKKIKKERYEGYVYDFSTETESFFAGEIPFLVHNTGHAGMTTFHSKNIHEMINRFTSEELGIEEKVIHSLKTAIFIGYRGVSKRKIYSIYEITEDEYIEVAKFNSVANRTELFFDRTRIFKDLEEVTGLDQKTIKEEYLLKILFLYYLKKKGINDRKEVTKYFYQYYTNLYKLAKHVYFELLKDREEIPTLKLKRIKEIEKFKNPYSKYKEIL